MKIRCFWAGTRKKSVFAGLCGSIVAAGLLGLTFACPAPEPPGPAAPDALDARLAKLAQPRWRYVGLKENPSDPCPAIPNWSATQLPPPSNRFCLYTSSGINPHPPQRPVNLRRLDPDTVALSPSGLAAATRDPLANRFLENVGQAGINLPSGSSPRVRLAFLDTLPTHDGGSAPVPECPGEHGDFLRRLGQALTCGAEGACAAQVTSRLALPVVTFDPASERGTQRTQGCGAALGSFVDLSTAILDEVAAWENNRQVEGAHHLILNLSLGWDPILFDHTSLEVPGLDAGVQLVHEALEVAQKRGALVFAAVGNDRSGPSPVAGALLPAGWEIGSTSHPLVYAVGGLAENDRPLGNARRRGARPSLAAYADHAALPEAENAYTGTSVATAVVSAIAAVLWNANPELDAAEVVAHLRASSPAVGTVDFAFGPNRYDAAAAVRRISLCPTLRALGPACRECAELRCAAPPASPLNLSSRLETISPMRPLREIFARETASLCGHREIWRPSIPLPIERLCPANRYRDRASEPWLHPQPGGDPCPNCVESGPPPHTAALPTDSPKPHVLYVEIRKDWDESVDGRLVSATVEVESARLGTIAKGFVLDRPAPHGHFAPGDLLAYELPAAIFPDSHYTVAISWHIRLGDKDYSKRTPILVVE